MRYSLLILGLFALVVAGGCSSQEKADAPAGDKAAGYAAMEVDPADYEFSDQAVSLAGIVFAPPADWTDAGPSGMRKASYYMAPVEGETDSAEVTVFYFGPSGGGAVQANLDRWVSQMVQPEGTDPGEAAEQYLMEIEGMPVHIVTATGAYTGSMGASMSSGTKDNYLMVGVVVEAPEGNVFFKLTGPEATAEQMTLPFMAMIKNISKS